MYNRVHIDPPPIHAIKCFGQVPISKATLFKRSCQKHVPDPDQTPFATVLLKTVPTSSRTPCGSPLSVTGDKPPFPFILVQREKVTISHSSLQGHAPSYLHHLSFTLFGRFANIQIFGLTQFFIVTIFQIFIRHWLHQPGFYHAHYFSISSSLFRAILLLQSIDRPSHPTSHKAAQILWLVIRCRDKDSFPTAVKEIYKAGAIHKAHFQQRIIVPKNTNS